MIILILWYGVSFVLSGWVLITQIITPLHRKTKLFPMFLAEEKLYSQLTETMQKKVEHDLEREIKKKTNSENLKMSSIANNDEE